MKASAIFTASSLTPVPLLLAAAFWSGAWAWIALIYLTVFAFLLDELIGVIDDKSKEFPAADVLSVSLAVLHFLTLAAVVWAFGRGPNLGEGIALFLAAGLFFGQVSNSNAHELIHRRSRFMHRLGKWVYISLLFGHHTSAHPLVHHRYVASHDDPNSARRGEGYYSFARRAWIGSFRAGLQAENARRGDKPIWRHPYATYFGGAAAMMIATILLAGLSGFIALIGLALFAQLQLLMSDYVQHYGLRRVKNEATLEPVGPQHSWNAPHVFTSHMMLHAPRHSAHHAHPLTPFNELDMPQAGDAPILPYSLPTMSVIALCPPLWKRVIDPRLAYWQTNSLAKLAT